MFDASMRTHPFLLLFLILRPVIIVFFRQNCDPIIPLV